MPFMVNWVANIESTDIRIDMHCELQNYFRLLYLSKKLQWLNFTEINTMSWNDLLDKKHIF